VKAALTISLLALVTCTLMANPLPPAEETREARAAASLLHDDTTFFDNSQREQLLHDLQTTREKAGTSLHIAVVPFLNGNVAVRDHALALANEWLGEQPGMVILANRGDGEGGIAASEGLWRLYPPDEAVLVLDDATTLLSNTRQPLETRVVQAVRLVSDRLVGMEIMRRARERTLAEQEARLAGWFAAMLLVIASMVWAGVAFRRRHEARRGAIFFPDVDVGTRLGAPFGGGVIGLAGEDE
jgi:uncharacterized membrane protein YgcG